MSKKDIFSALLHQLTLGLWQFFFEKNNKKFLPTVFLPIPELGNIWCNKCLQRQWLQFISLTVFGFAALDISCCQVQLRLLEINKIALLAKSQKLSHFPSKMFFFVHILVPNEPIWKYVNVKLSKANFEDVKFRSFLSSFITKVATWIVFKNRKIHFSIPNF